MSNFPLAPTSTESILYFQSLRKAECIAKIFLCFGIRRRRCQFIAETLNEQETGGHLRTVMVLLVVSTFWVSDILRDIDKSSEFFSLWFPMRQCYFLLIDFGRGIFWELWGSCADEMAYPKICSLISAFWKVCSHYNWVAIFGYMLVRCDAGIVCRSCGQRYYKFHTCE